MKSKQRSREFWEKEVARAESSGTTRAECAKELGVGVPALNYWIHKLRSERRGSLSGGRCRALVPVRVVDSEPVRNDGLCLEVRGIFVRFDEQTPVEYVARLAGALQQC